MGKHALLSASSSSRWMNCPPSARLCETYTDQGSNYAAEGTDAHTLGEYKLKSALGICTKDPTKTLSHYSKEMDECADNYATYIMELYETAKQTCVDPVLLIEQRLDFSKYVKEGFGTGDALIVSDETLHIVDYKHGQGVLVEAESNPQMMLYALGALEIFDGIYDINTVYMTIFQPRRDNVSTYEISKESLYHWANETLKPIAELAFAGDGNYKCGEWCRFCKAKNECRARADYNLELLKYDFKLPPLLDDSEIETILSQIDDLVAWAEAIKEYAFKAALGGKKWNGWKLVEGKSNRKYTNEDAVAKKVITAGYEPYEKSLLGITKMEKLLGKPKFKEILGELVTKPPGKPTLAPMSDKRDEINISDVADDFNEPLDDE